MYFCLLTYDFFLSFEKQIKEVMHKAFWDALQEKLNEDPPDFSQAIILLDEVREVGFKFVMFLI